MRFFVDCYVCVLERILGFLCINVVGDKIDWLAIQIRNTRRQPVVCLPDAPSLKYTVVLEILRRGNDDQSSLIMSHLCKIPMVMDEDNSIVTGDGRSALADKYFFFQNLLNIPLGTHEMKLTVKDADREVKSFSKELKVIFYYVHLVIKMIRRSFL